eukprot:sb/3468260/
MAMFHRGRGNGSKVKRPFRVLVNVPTDRKVMKKWKKICDWDGYLRFHDHEGPLRVCSDHFKISQFTKEFIEDAYQFIREVYHECEEFPHELIVSILRDQPYIFDERIVKHDALPTLLLGSWDREKLKKEPLTKEQICELDREELEACGLGEFTKEWYPGVPDSDEENENLSDSESDSEEEDEDEDEDEEDEDEDEDEEDEDEDEEKDEDEDEKDEESESESKTKSKTKGESETKCESESKTKGDDDGWVTDSDGWVTDKENDEEDV